MYKLRLVVIFALVELSTTPAASQQPAFLSMEKADRLSWIVKQADEYELKVTRPDAPLHREKPLLRFNDNVSGVVDAVLFAWGRDGRPEACASFWFRRDGQKTHEFVSLSRGMVVATRNKNVVWATDAPGLSFVPIPESPKPSKSKSIRMTQMRQISRRFQAAATVDSREFNLRLLTQPMIRYTPAGTQIIDGAIFNYAKGTNPEVLLVIEAIVDDDGNRRFEYAPVRMTSRACWLLLDDKKVWSVPFNFGRKSRGTYRNVVTRDQG